ncbi:hypothetical protein Acr_00g0005660 [Actinidia rufa]|uniref:Uncharacterized protein n=1 Tax=Actinidia rufa TaxID=165716 RepID=A0A7J0D7S7_9ERIC|nr:hypothetical protein Acr_00g0005660 [Actinidia rufa]
MICPRTKHASMTRGLIIMGWEIERNFPLKYYQKILAPMDALGWNGFQSLPDDVYKNLVRFFYYNLEVWDLDNIEYTIDSRVREKNIVLTPTAYSEITGIANVRDCIFIRKPSQLDQYIAHNIIPKAGDYNQVTTMDAFIIYRAEIDEPLNLNYIILKEMTDVRNHSSRALPYGALLTKVFSRFRVKVNGQRYQYISKGFSITTINRGISVDSTREEEGDEETSHHSLEVEGNLEVPPPHTEETYEETTQNFQLKWKNEETMHEGVPMKEKYRIHGGHPLQEETSSQGWPPPWFLKYFEKLNEIIEHMEKYQEEHAKQLEQVLQNQERQEKYIDRLGNLYENLYEQQNAFN